MRTVTPQAYRTVIVAIDGPASSGKSTTARAVAQKVGLLYLDTGAMYRAVALAFLRAGIEPDPAEAERVLDALHVDVDHDEDGAMRVTLDGDDVTGELRAPAVTRRASEVSALPAVREKLVEEQRRIAAACEAEGGGVVLDGRDIGTIVFPEADVKIFLVADAEVRARRRRAELLEKNGEAPPLEEVLENIRRRDAQDRAREMSPLRQAEDAVALDTTERSIEEQVEFVAQRVRTYRAAA
jgi:cytidylate kinase